jgi:RNA polymerase sigma-70 factor (ECF subfamily)
MGFDGEALSPGTWIPIGAKGQPVTARSATAGPAHDDLHAADDARLVEWFLGGRREAFDVIVERYRAPIYRLCYRFTGNHEDAADLAQDVFVRAFRGLHQFQGNSALGTWLHRVGVNTALNRNAVKKMPTDSIDDVELRDHRVADPVERIDGKRRSLEVRRAIDQLPPKQRVTVILRVYQDLSYDEIAEALDTTTGAAKANVYHALGTLKRMLTP